jgi:polyferredoxin
MNSKQLATSKEAQRLFWLERTVEILDDRFRIPGTRITFGMDPLISLVPWLGDMVSFAISGLLVVVMVRHGASGMVVVKMIGNILLDATIGAVPFLGDLFDLTFRANRRNLRLLKEHYEEDRHGGSARWVVYLVIFILIALMSLLTVLFIQLLSWVFQG